MLASRTVQRLALLSLFLVVDQDKRTASPSASKYRDGSADRTKIVPEDDRRCEKLRQRATWRWIARDTLNPKSSSEVPQRPRRWWVHRSQPTGWGDRSVGQTARALLRGCTEFIAGLHAHRGPITDQTHCTKANHGMYSTTTCLVYCCRKRRADCERRTVPTVSTF